MSVPCFLLTNKGPIFYGKTHGRFYCFMVFEATRSLAQTTKLACSASKHFQMVGLSFEQGQCIALRPHPLLLSLLT